MSQNDWWKSKSVKDLLREVLKRPHAERKKFLLAAALLPIIEGRSDKTMQRVALLEQAAEDQEVDSESPTSLDELFPPADPEALYQQFIEHVNRGIPDSGHEAVSDLLDSASGYRFIPDDPFDFLLRPGEHEKAEEAKRVIADVFGYTVGRGRGVRPPTVAPKWLTSDVQAVAVGIDETGDFDGLPILADALQEAGCDNEDLLTHLRSGGVHVRGCWALDLVLGRC